MPANTKYVGRPTKWGNPYEINKDEENGKCSVWHNNNGSPILIIGGVSEETALQVALDKYADYIRRYISYGHLNIDELKGKNLACFCSLSSRCHADILLELCR